MVILYVLSSIFLLVDVFLLVRASRKLKLVIQCENDIVQAHDEILQREQELLQREGELLSDREVIEEEAEKLLQASPAPTVDRRARYLNRLEKSMRGLEMMMGGPR